MNVYYSNHLIRQEKLGLFCTSLIYVGSRIRIWDDKKRPDPDPGSRIRDKHPGFTTLVVT
jgi:hypothetical protein